MPCLKWNSSSKVMQCVPCLSAEHHHYPSQTPGSLQLTLQLVRIPCRFSPVRITLVTSLIIRLMSLIVQNNNVLFTRARLLQSPLAFVCSPPTSTVVDLLSTMWSWNMCLTIPFPLLTAWPQALSPYSCVGLSLIFTLIQPSCLASLCFCSLSLSYFSPESFVLAMQIVPYMRNAALCLCALTDGVICFHSYSPLHVTFSFSIF